MRTPTEYLAELVAIARARGGELLSPRYVDDTTKLAWRCAEGHEWKASPGKIKQDRWCPECGKFRMGAKKRAAAYAKLRQLVRHRRGAILSPTYVNSQTHMRFRCAAGHEWEAVPESVLMGTWCRKCASVDVQERRRSAVLTRLARSVERLGGKLLSTRFEGASAPLRVRCGRGHERRMLYAAIEQGVACPRCKEADWLADMRAWATVQGGACLSKSCGDAASRVRFECSLGHRFESPATRVKQGHWCPLCRQASPLGLDQMREIARERGGECLSKRYVDSASDLRWKCAEGHEWRARAGSILRGTWCRICTRGQGKSRRALDLGIMRRMAAERGGECLSEEYFGIYDRLRWRCARGHEWVTPANNVRRGGWCPECSFSVLGTFERLRALALERGGRCVTHKWNDHGAPLLFECGRGHRFQLRANVLKSGVWCPVCPSGADGSGARRPAKAQRAAREVRRARASTSRTIATRPLRNSRAS